MDTAFSMDAFFSLRGILIVLLAISSLFGILFRPKIGILIIFILTILRAGFLYEWFPLVYDLHVPQIYIIFTSIAWLMHSGRYPLRFNLDMALIIVFFAVICASRYFFGTPIFDNKVAQENLREVTLFFLVLQLVRTPRDMRQLLWVIVLLYLFLALRGYYFYKTEYWDIALPNYQYVNRNGFANALAFICPIAFVLARGTKNITAKCTGLFASFWCIVGVILTYSRGGLLALFSGLIGLFIVEKHKIRMIVIIALLSAFILPRLSEKYINRIKTIETYDADASAMGRVATNHAAINMVKTYPLLGVGAGNFNDVFMDFTPPEERQWVDYGKSVHNMMMQVASETGMVGLSIFVLILIRAMGHTFLWPKPPQPVASHVADLAVMLRIALLAIIVGQQFGQGAYFGELYLLLSFAAAFSIIKKDKAALEEQNAK